MSLVREVNLASAKVAATEASLADLDRHAKMVMQLTRKDLQPLLKTIARSLTQSVGLTEVLHSPLQLSSFEALSPVTAATTTKHFSERHRSKVVAKISAVQHSIVQAKQLFKNEHLDAAVATKWAIDQAFARNSAIANALSARTSSLSSLGAEEYGSIVPYSPMMSGEKRLKFMKTPRRMNDLDDSRAAGTNLSTLSSRKRCWSRRVRRDTWGAFLACTRASAAAQADSVSNRIAKGLRGGVPSSPSLDETSIVLTTSQATNIVLASTFHAKMITPKTPEKIAAGGGAGNRGDTGGSAVGGGTTSATTRSRKVAQSSTSKSSFEVTAKPSVFGNTIVSPPSSSSSSQPPIPGKAPSSAASLFGGSSAIAASSSPTPFGARVSVSPAAGPSSAPFMLGGAPFQSAGISKPLAAATTFSFGNANSAGSSVPSAPVFGTGIDTGTTPFSATSSSTFGGTKTGSPQSGFGISSFGGSPQSGFGIGSFGAAPNVSSTPTPSFGGIGVPSAPAFGVVGKGIGTTPFATGSSTFGSTSFSTKRSTAGVGLFGSASEGGSANAASAANVDNVSASDNSANKNSSSGGAGVVPAKQNSSFTKFRG